MENSVSAAPLLVRKGTTYTKLAVTQAERKGAVLHLGTGKGRVRPDKMKSTRVSTKPPPICAHRPRRAPSSGGSGPEHNLAAGDPSVPITGAHQQHIIAPGRASAHDYALIRTCLCRAHTCWLRVSRVRLWWAATCMWPESPLKAAVFIPAVRCVPEPEVWVVNGTQRKKPARKQQQSECIRNRGTGCSPFWWL